MFFGSWQAHARIADSRCPRSRFSNEHYLRPHPHLKFDLPKATSEPSGKVAPTALPVRPMSAKATEVVHAVDIISDYAEQIDWGFVSHLMETGAYSQLPDRIRPKQDLPPQIEFSLAIVPAPHDPSKHVILKLYTFMEGGKNVKKPVATARALCDGIPYMIDCPSARTATICFKYMWQMMGGMQARPWQLAQKDLPIAKEPRQNFFATLTDEEINDGFSYIRKVPRTDENLRQSIWITKALSRATPIHNWPPAVVEKAVRSLIAEGAFAKKHKFLPWSLKHVQDLYVDKILGRVFDMLLTKAIIMLGEAGAGKTPLAKAIALAVASYHYDRSVDTDFLEEPCFRCTQDIDFLRVSPGSKTIVDIIDDGDMNTIPIRKMKAGTDVGEAETMSRERWTAVKWVAGQLRILCDNKYNPQFEPKDHSASYVEHEAFFQHDQAVFLEGS